MRRLRWLLVPGVLGLLFALAWRQRDRFLPVEVGSPAPPVVATDLAGRPVRLDQLRGRVVLLNIWATWCEPCRDEMPSMERLHRQLGPAGLEIVAVSVDAAAGLRAPGGQLGGDVAAFARNFGLTFRIWRDPSGAIQRAYRTTGIPETFVIGRDGRVLRKVIGATEWDSPDNVEWFRTLLRGA